MHTQPLTPSQTRQVIEDTLDNLPVLPHKAEIEGMVAKMYNCGIHFSEALHEFRKRFILYVLMKHKGNACKAALDLQIHRNTLSRTCTELGIVRNRAGGFSDKQDLARKHSSSVSDNKRRERRA